MTAGKEDLLYLAGLIDGEGCISLFRSKRKGKCSYHTYASNNPNYHIELRIEMSKAKKLFFYYKEILGGSIWQRKRKGRDCIMYCWSVSGSNLKKLLIFVCPYLKLKQKEARLALEFISLLKKKAFYNALTNKELQLRENIYQKLKKAKRREQEWQEGIVV